jgi:hypothetical protein
VQQTGSQPSERRRLQRLRPAAQRGVVRHGEVKPEQSDDGADRPSVCRSARPNTKPIVRAVLIPGRSYLAADMVRACARHVRIASSVNLTARRPPPP